MLSILSNTNILSILSEILRSGGQDILSILSEILRSGGQAILSILSNTNILSILSEILNYFAAYTEGNQRRRGKVSGTY